MESHQGTTADTTVSLFPAAILLQHTSVVINTLTAARRLTPCCQAATVTDKHKLLTLHTSQQHTSFLDINSKRLQLLARLCTLTIWLMETDDTYSKIFFYKTKCLFFLAAVCTVIKSEVLRFKFMAPHYSGIYISRCCICLASGRGHFDLLISTVSSARQSLTYCHLGQHGSLSLTAVTTCVLSAPRMITRTCTCHRL